MDDYKSPNNLYFVVAIIYQAFIVPPLSGEGPASAAEPFEGGTGTVSLLDIWTGFSLAGMANERERTGFSIN